MNKRFLRLLQFALVFIDLSAIIFVYLAAILFFDDTVDPGIEYVYFLIALILSWICMTTISNVYSEANVKVFEHFTNASVKAFSYFILAIVVYLFFFRLLTLSRLFVSAVFACIFVALIINRIIYFGAYYFFRTRHWMVNKVIVIGYNALSKKLVNYLAEDRINKEVVGFCEEFDNIHELSPYPILSSIGDTLGVCKKFGVTEIYSTISPEQNVNLYKMMQAADENCIRFRIVPDLRMFYNKQMHIDHLKEMVIITARKEPLNDLGNRIKKRLLDIGFSIFVIVFVLSWITPIIGFLICLESPGPILFKQHRTGKDQTVFLCLKFRSMRLNSEADTSQAVARDERVTRIGRFLRRTSLDELPQFINVLKGDMSVVGPRPHMLRHTNEYSKLIGQYMVRQFLKPGITGWAQVNGFRGETHQLELMKKRVEHDLWYMENWSFLLDVKIILMTAFNWLRSEKYAY
jgi:putative colanic acid biosynthesis UDP-glucose lipid carrier transferase